MKVSYKWLKDYIDIDLTPAEMDDILTQIGLEVGGIEKIQSIKGGLEGLVIGEVKTCIPHPNSDHLSITSVDVNGEELLPIVCGAANVAAGQKVVVATVGTVLYDGDESFTIKKSKIRGEVSLGMICAEDEIGVGTGHEGIMELPLEAVVGTPAAKYFNVEDDIAIEIDLTPNRIDGASHIGVARDLAAYLKQQKAIEYKMPSVEAFKVENNSTPIEVVVENPEACHRYSGVCVSGVTIAESPEWLQNRLKAIGLKPINNIVDITNFVLFETGQPLHAFDYSKIAGNKVIVKTLAGGAQFTTLDETKRELNENDLMICNAEEPMCIAGVFGGLESGVSASTTSVFLESAYFDSVSVRKTARRHGLNTDASFRFERGTDPNNTIYAMKRAALLIKEIAGGIISSEVIDIYPNPVADFKVEVSVDRIERLIGKKIGKETIKNILTALEIGIEKEDDDTLNLLVPPYRVDVKREADIVEEVLRIYGFNNVEVPGKVNASLSYAPKPDEHKLRNTIADLLSYSGFNEIMNNSLTKASYYENLESLKPENTVRIFNPLSSDLNAMRQSLLFGGLECIAYNINRRNMDLKFYEFGKSYQHFKNEENENPVDNYFEKEHLSVFMCGNKTAANWNLKEEPTNFFHIKAFTENVLKRLGFKIDKLRINEIENDQFTEGLSYGVKKKVLVEVGMVSGKILKEMNIDVPVYYADFDWETLIGEATKNKIAYTEIPKYPAVKRDLALLIDKATSFAEIKTIAFNCEKNLLKSVSLFDIYEGEKLGADKKSYAVSFILQDTVKTLEDKQIDKIMQKLIKSYEKQLGAQIR
ncbi:phenylalanine--tRNA ligase subunit beta [Labilibaculum euxinus]|uniref:Phenylalanine--tRNA ligase beta subunit n=1 Tax=Labilibaculum euxinus TaxID=2686357 RepID=A0A7M4D3E3_9BACT|nr:phenylalanine--tRNA ligase subunit beta [Labilibaculum euxinus]MUP37172.1 phenylalanine--tRNA ligase subunit beta [Labilibaculum euxinus]MVB06377.1 phenylalanine--tRNA ligase subunit beta [Labilibaculum euxinus]